MLAWGEDLCLALSLPSPAPVRNLSELGSLPCLGLMMDPLTSCACHAQTLGAVSWWWEHCHHRGPPSSWLPIPKQAAVPWQQHLSAQSSMMSLSCHSQNFETHQLSLWSPPLTAHICQVYKADTQLSGSQAWKEKEIASLQNQERKQEHSVLLHVNTIIKPLENRETEHLCIKLTLENGI